MRKPVVLVAAIAGVVAVVARKRQASHADIALWREATAEDSR